MEDLAAVMVEKGEEVLEADLVGKEADMAEEEGMEGLAAVGVVSEEDMVAVEVVNLAANQNYSQSQSVPNMMQ